MICDIEYICLDLTRLDSKGIHHRLLQRFALSPMRKKHTRNWLPFHFFLSLSSLTFTFAISSLLTLPLPLPLSLSFHRTPPKRGRVREIIGWRVWWFRWITRLTSLAVWAICCTNVTFRRWKGWKRSFDVNYRHINLWKNVKLIRTLRNDKYPRLGRVLFL